MVSASVNKNTMKGFTLIELLVVVAIIALLISILLPSLTDAREQARKVKCGANLHGLAQAMMLCANENEGYFPTWDDEAKYAYQDPKTGFSMMASWADTLFDLGYAANRDMQLCPTRRKDEYFSSNRGKAWGTGYVNRFGVGEDFKPGNYTAYGLNALVHYNWEADLTGNETRQIMAMDAAWTWFGNINAAYMLKDTIGWPMPGEPYETPDWDSTMHAWRHGRQRQSQAAFLDGHVEAITPKVPHNFMELFFETVDTERYFTWLPGELPLRHCWEPYRGIVTEWTGRLPKFAAGGGDHPRSYPDELSTRWRSGMDPSYVGAGVIYDRYNGEQRWREFPGGLKRK